MICKVVFKQTVFGEFDTLDEARRYFGLTELVDVTRECDDGDLIGGVEMSEVEMVPLDQVPDQLRAIGNDGSFFNLDRVESQEH